MQRLFAKRFVQRVASASPRLTAPKMASSSTALSVQRRRLHLSYPAVAGRASTDYVIRTGDVLAFQQYQSANARGGMAIWFQDGTNTNWVTADQDGQAINSLSSTEQRRFRRVSLSAYANRRIGAISLLTDVGTQPGSWDIVYRDIVLISLDARCAPSTTARRPHRRSPGIPPA
jgi:hypothetical protein